MFQKLFKHEKLNQTHPKCLFDRESKNQNLKTNDSIKRKSYFICVW